MKSSIHNSYECDACPKSFVELKVLKSHYDVYHKYEKFPRKY